MTADLFMTTQKNSIKRTQRVQVFVRLKPAVLDVQGKAVESVAHRLGYENIENIRVGRLIEFEVPAGADAKAIGEKLAATMLGNPVIENTEVLVG